jgi:hypothetical protein
MHTEMALRDAGMKILIDNLGKIEAERFISIIIRDPFDYTEWQRDLFNHMSIKELSHLAMEAYNNESES